MSEVKSFEALVMMWQQRAERYDETPRQLLREVVSEAEVFLAQLPATELEQNLRAWAQEMPHPGRKRLLLEAAAVVSWAGTDSDLLNRTCDDRDQARARVADLQRELAATFDANVALIQHRDQLEQELAMARGRL